MTHDTDANRAVSHPITRRRALTGVAAGVTGVVGLTHLSGDASADASVSGEFDATGDDATLSDAPDAITVSATGEFAVDATSAVEQVRVTLQATVENETDDLAEDIHFDETSGSYAIDADLIADHRDLEAGDFMPVEGETKTTDVRLRIVAGVVQNGSIVTEADAEDTVSLTIDHEGVVVSVGGSADVTIQSD